MEKLITICFLMAATFTAKAQNLTIKETVEWLNQNSKNLKGVDTGRHPLNYKDYKISFTSQNIVIKSKKYKTFEIQFSKTTEISQILLPKGKTQIMIIEPSAEPRIKTYLSFDCDGNCEDFVQNIYNLCLFNGAKTEAWTRDWSKVKF